MNKLIVIASALIVLSAVNSPARDNKISRQLQHKMALGSVSDAHLCWVLFADKDLSKSFPRLESPAAKRRVKIGRELSYGDLPVSSEYIDRIKRTGAEIRVISPWLNAVSIKATAGQISGIADINGVKGLEEVAVYTRPSKIEELPIRQTKEAPALEYGPSLDQIKMMKIDQLHQKGYSGSGVRLTIIDTGFDRWHESLLRVRVIAERDFQRVLAGGEPDSVTSYQSDQDFSLSQTGHGTAMLSIAGGYKSGQLIGSAYNADFILAKTEKDSGDDFYQEEDWWVAALQWAADSIGTDIVSSSLGYRYWSDSSQYNYGYDQMDGDQARCSRAADSAASRGVLILNALGNIRNNSRPDTSLVAPSDADSIIAVGGAWASTGEWSTGAVTGPPSDSIKIKATGRTDSFYIRRIKPEIASCWQNYCARNEPDPAGNYNQYWSSPGTSGATALTAGLCALLLEAHPSWGPQDVIEALKYSGSNRSTVEAFFTVPESLDITLGSDPIYNPGFADIATGHKYYTSGGTTYDLYDVYRIGWGVPDGIKALNYTAPEVVLAEADQLLDPYPNPVKASDGGLYLPFFLIRDSYSVIIRLYSLDGRRIRKLDLGERLAGSYPSQINIIKNRTGSQQPAFWDLNDDKGKPVPSGLYIALLTTGWNQSSKKIMVLR